MLMALATVATMAVHSLRIIKINITNIPKGYDNAADILGSFKSHFKYNEASYTRLFLCFWPSIIALNTRQKACDALFLV